MYNCRHAVEWRTCWMGWTTHTVDNQYMYTWTDCKPGFFFYEFAAQYSSMLLAVMSIEKCIALFFPLKAKSYCTVGTAKWVTTILAVIMAAFNSPIFIWYKIIGKYCDITKHRDYFIMLNTLFYALVPIFTMLLTNVAILCKLMYIKYKGMSGTNESVSKSSTRGSVMVVTVSLVFIILTTPRVVDNVFRLKITLSHLRNLFTATMMYLNHTSDSQS